MYSFLCGATLLLFSNAFTPELATRLQTKSPVRRRGYKLTWMKAEVQDDDVTPEKMTLEEKMA